MLDLHYRYYEEKVTDYQKEKVHESKGKISHFTCFPGITTCLKILFCARNTI